MSEYDAKSRASTKEFRANYDSIFKKKPCRKKVNIPGLGSQNCQQPKGHEGPCSPANP